MYTDSFPTVLYYTSAHCIMSSLAEPLRRLLHLVLYLSHSSDILFVSSLKVLQILQVYLR